MTEFSIVVSSNSAWDQKLPRVNSKRMGAALLRPIRIVSRSQVFAYEESRCRNASQLQLAQAGGVAASTVHRLSRK